jgi:hypothetical protein
MKNTAAKLLGSVFLATGVASAVMIAPAHALTGVCSVNNVKYNSGGIAATACRGELETNSIAWPENNDVTGSGQPLLGRLNTLFNRNYDWSFVGKDEVGVVPSASGGFDGYSNAQVGTWTVTEALTGPFAISVKGSDGFAVYLFENLNQAVTSGTWSTAGLLNNGGRQPNLSHISLFKVRSVPEPATIIGLGVIAAGMLVARRRQASC